MASTETIQGSNIDPAIEIPEVDDTSVTGRAKDGVPTWDGNPTSYQEYEESALLWEQSVAMQKRYLCGPRLAAEFTGAAKRLVAGRHPEWLSHHDGVRRLTEHLRHSLGKPLLSELTEQLSRFFKGSRRRSGESINDYITRKNEIYLRACQALQRVAPQQRLPHRPAHGQRHGPQAAAAASPAWPVNLQRNHTPAAKQALPQRAVPLRQLKVLKENLQAVLLNQGGETVIGMDGNLLQDAGLTSHERNVAQTAIQGDFSMARVAQELRSQCSVLDGAKKDYTSFKNTGYLGDIPRR